MLPIVPPRGIYIKTPREEHETRNGEGTSPFLEIPVSAASPTTEGVKGFKLSGT